MGLFNRGPRYSRKLIFPKRVTSAAVPEDLKVAYNKYSKIVDYCTYALYIVFGVGILLGLLSGNPKFLDPCMYVAIVVVAVTIGFCLKRKSIYEKVRPYLVREEIARQEEMRKQYKKYPSKYK